MPAEPELSYEIPEEDLEELRQQHPLQRKPTIVDSLRDQLALRKKEPKGRSAL